MFRYKNLDSYLIDSTVIKGGKYIKSKNIENNEDLVSVIIICRNAENTINKTIDSVFSQNYKYVELLIIDGNSNDKTVNILEMYNDSISFWLSEKDDGPADAINKGLTLSRGNYIFILAADDILPSNFFEIGIKTLKNTSFNFVFGDLELFSFDHNNIYNRQKGDPQYQKKIKYVMPKINQPSIIFTRHFFESVGYQNINYKVAPDYDWLLRGYLKNLVGIYNEKLYIKFSTSGNSNINFLQGIKEVKNISYSLTRTKFLNNLYYLKSLIGYFIRKFFVFKNT